ncbi:hypothetical protein ABX022_16380 [Snodgrassella alvi]|uniref:hypothetical protein n=1 Tax=Snodgrassella alvi TaxID=1196083 RepID=UPI00351BF7F6
MITYKDLCNAWKKDIDTKSKIRTQLIEAALKFAFELAKNLGLQDKRYNLNGQEKKYVRLDPYKNGEKSEDNFLDIPMFKNEDIFYIDYALSLVLERDEKSSQRTNFYIPFKNYIENENLIIQVNDGRPQSDKTRFEIPVTSSEYSDIEAAFQAPVEEYKRMIMEKYKAL